MTPPDRGRGPERVGGGEVPEAPVTVVGATGQLGTELVARGRLLGLDVVARGHDSVDVTDPRSLRDALRDDAPWLVVNAAAMVDVDACEDVPETAFQVNALGALHVAQAARAVEARTVLVSTDSVFDGLKPFPSGDDATADTSYSERDCPAPLNVYGASKHAGERLTLASDPRALVARLGVLFGPTGARGKGGTNFIDTMVRLARTADAPLRVVDDQWISPTHAGDAAQATLEAALAGATGVLHVANRGACTWRRLADHAVRQVRPEVAVDAIPADAFPRKSRRPPNTVLAVSGIERVVGHPMRPWRAAVDAYLRERGHLQPSPDA